MVRSPERAGCPGPVSRAPQKEAPVRSTIRRITTTTTLALGIIAAALPATAVAADVVGPDLVPCIGDQDVTVVVDFTDLGGQVESGCATAGATGTEALVEAGFTDTRDGAGMICALNALPDPCPAEFTGSYWSYWFAGDTGWESYLEGSDTAVTTAGGIEGWRYSDGTAGPQVSPVAGEAAAEGTADETITATPVSAPVQDGLSTAAIAGIILAVLLAGAAAVIGLRRRHDTLGGTDHTDHQD